ncbi:MAG: zinc-ribbon domain-containing protein [Peptococcaceae bacterium]|nr:zinc-ribbon domain-containing protein [Peptococcaceae bacterium]
MNCPSCQRALQDDFKFCPHCGAPIANNCYSCGKQVDPAWVSCPHCGAGLKGRASQHHPVNPPPAAAAAALPA